MSLYVPDISYVVMPDTTGPLVGMSEKREPVNSPDRNSTTETTWRCKTRAEEDDELYMRYWRNVRRARKKRDFKGALDWLGMMRTLKRFRETDVEDRYPPIYKKCHKVILKFIPKYKYREIAEFAGCTKSAIHNVLRKNWREVHEDYVQEIYDNLVRARI